MSPKNNLDFGKFTSYLSNIPSKIMKAHPLKKAYSFLWLLTVIFLITEIALLIVSGGNITSSGPAETANRNFSSASELNAVAAIAVVFVVSLTASIFTTVIASQKLKKLAKNDKKAGK